MITNVRFCLSYDLLNAILSPSKFVYINDNLNYNRNPHYVTCSYRKCNVTCGHNIMNDMKLSMNNSNVMTIKSHISAMFCKL